MKTYKINEARERTGLSARQIREYQRLDLIEDAHRTSGDQRLFDEEQLERLAFIKRMRDAQLSLADIKLILRLLSRSAFGLEREGMQRVRAILAGARRQMAVADEILAALEDRASRHRPPPPPGSGARAA